MEATFFEATVPHFRRIQIVVVLKDVLVKSAIPCVEISSEIALQENHDGSRTVIGIKKSYCHIDSFCQSNLSGLVKGDGDQVVLQFFELIEDKFFGDSGTVNGAEIPSIGESFEMIGVNMGENVDILVERVMSALAEVINDDVGEIDFAHGG